MKNRKNFLFVLFLLCAHCLKADDCCKEQDTCVTTDFSAGYVFKRDCRFKAVYGHGMINCITADLCYYPWSSWGIGTRVSYLRATGHTTFLRRSAHAQEIPFTFYLRKTFDFDCGLQTVLSLGGGVAWLREKSCCPDTIKMHTGIGEGEVGLRYQLCPCLQLISAFRYLFPRQTVCCNTADVGGFDLRAGIGVSF